MKLEDFLKDVTEKRLKLGSISEGSAVIYGDAARRLPQALRNKDVCKVARKDIEQAVMDMHARALSPKTIRHTLNILASALNDAVDDGIIPANPALRVKTPKAKGKLNRNLQDTDIKTALQLSKNHDFGWLFRFALGSGLRRGELLALDWGDIDFGAGVVTVSKNMVKVGSADRLSTPKTTASYRKVTLPPALIQEALQLRGTQGPDKPVFAGKRGQRLSLSAASIGIKDLLMRAGIKDQTLHSLRHTHVSQLVSSGLPLPAIAQRAGHSSVHTTLGIYAHAAKGEDEKAAREIEKAF